LPNTLFLKFTKEFGLSEYDANILVDEKEVALYYNELCLFTKNYKSAANFVNGSIKSYLNENAVDISDFNISAKRLASLITILNEGKVSSSVATSKIFPEMLKTDDLAEKIATDNNWMQESNSDILSDYIKKAIAKYPEKVAEYKTGKKGLIGLFMGEVMKLSKGKADPKLANQLLRTELEK
jgi:aspartyl-tRNA(Asn)/glutamyl-tRNA(Gln) amidotransferase subunit B